MMAEDAADRYLITGLENRTTNRLVIILARKLPESRPVVRECNGLSLTVAQR